MSGSSCAPTGCPTPSSTASITSSTPPIPLGATLPRCLTASDPSDSESGLTQVSAYNRWYYSSPQSGPRCGHARQHEIIWTQDTAIFVQDRPGCAPCGLAPSCRLAGQPGRWQNAHPRALCARTLRMFRPIEQPKQSKSGMQNSSAHILNLERIPCGRPPNTQIQTFVSGRQRSI